MRNNKHFRYGHILWLDEIKFSPRIPKLICDPDNQLEAEQHVFITPFKKVFDEISKYTENAVLADVSNPYSADVINQYAENCDWLIVHSMPQPHHALGIKRKFRRKIIWRTWGHDVGYKHHKGQWLKNAGRSVFEFFWRREVRQFHAIGIANTVDKIAITKEFGQLRFYPIPYSRRSSHDDLVNARESMKKESEVIKILVGHSGHSGDNHIEILKRLEKFKNENINLTFILSYGDPEHINKVTRYVNTNWSEKSTIITEMMSPGDYIKLLSQMDVAFFDGLHSTALGNITILLYLKKKIFLNRDGVIREAFDLENVPYYYTDDVENMTFEEFSAPLVYEDTKNDLEPKSYEENVGRWRKLLDDLNAEGGAR